MELDITKFKPLYPIAKEEGTFGLATTIVNVYGSMVGVLKLINWTEGETTSSMPKAGNDKNLLPETPKLSAHDAQHAAWLAAIASLYQILTSKNKLKKETDLLGSVHEVL